MNDYIKDHIKNHINGRIIGLFGIGKQVYVAEKLLREIGISKYVYFDNDIKKQNVKYNILNPSNINTDYFIIVSTVHFHSIKKQLDALGLKEMTDYIWALDLDFYDAMLQYKNSPSVPDLILNDLLDLEIELKKYVDVRTVDWFSETEFQNFEKNLGFQTIYNKAENKRYRRKIMEYYCVNKLLKLDEWDEKDIYIDVGAASSPFAKYLRENKGIKSFAVDISDGLYSEIPYYIKEDATDMHFPDDSVTGISMQSAFEMFAGSADIDFIREAARILKKGGKVVIAPLYLHKKYLSTMSPNYYCMGIADVGSLKCIRTDCRGAIPFARFYSIESLNERILKFSRKCGLTPLVYTLPQELVEKDQFVYLKFILVLEK